MKRILSLLLAVALVLTMLPVMTPRVEAKTGGPVWGFFSVSSALMRVFLGTPAAFCLASPS